MHGNGLLIVSKERLFAQSRTLYTVRPDGTGKQMFRRAGGRSSLTIIAPAPDGRRVLAQRTLPGGGIADEVVSLPGGRRLRSLSDLGQLTRVSGHDGWSPSGRWLAISTPGALQITHPDGSGTRPVTTTDDFLGQIGWSRNGRCLVGQPAFGSSGGSVAVVAADGSARSSFSVGRGAGVEWPTFAPDGQHVIVTVSHGRAADAYSFRLDGTGRRRVARMLDAAEPVIVSPDGRWLAYRDRQGTIVRPVTGGAARRLLRGLYIVAWAPRPH